MSTSQVGPGVAAAPVTEPCAACGAPLAADQRYCLHCGEPRAGARRAMPSRPRGSIHAGDEGLVAVSRARREPMSLAVMLAGLACLLLAIGVGVLIGRGSGDAATQAPLTVAAAPAAGAASAAAAFTSDWPAGRDGWTVAVALLPKATTTPAAVVAAKSAATGGGATAVGALDSDAYPSLTGGSYVVYSGDFSSEQAATGALEALTSKFPEARVVHVGATAAATPAAKGGSKSGAATTKPAAKKPASAATTQNEFEKSKKAPKTVGTGGKPPPKDNKPAAGGGGFEDIG